MASDDSQTPKYCSSDTSDDEQYLKDGKKTSKGIHHDRIARDLIRSRDHVDKRLLRLKEIGNRPTQKTDVQDHSGVNASHIRSNSIAPMT